MRPRFRLWHLFAFTAFIAAAVFVASNLGIIFEWQPKTGNDDFCPSAKRKQGITWDFCGVLRK